LPRIKSLLDEIVPTLLAVSGVDTSSTDTFGKCIAYLKKLSPTARTPAFGKAAEQLKRHGMDLCELFIQICNLYKIYNCDVGIIALKLEENVTGGGGCYAGHRNRLLEALRHCLDANCGAGLSAPLTFKVLELRNILSRIF
jgi:hypothetical protein